MGSEETSVEALTEEVARLRKRVAELKSVLAGTPGMSRDMFKRLVESMGTSFFVIRGGKTVYANRVCEALTEYSNDELLNMPFLDLIHPDSRELMMERYAARQGGDWEDPSPFEVKIVTKSGRVRWLEAGGGYAELEDGPVVFGIGRDITDRLQTQEALKKTEREKAVILNVLSEHVLYQDLDHRIIWANRAAAESVNLSPEELVGRRCHEVWHGRDTPCERCPVAKAQEIGTRWSGEIDSPDGRSWIVSGYPVPDDAGVAVGVVETTLDITDRRRMEDELIMARKLESLGVLAGGIAHDFNNIMTAILGSISLAKMDAFSSRAQLLERLESAEKAVLMARNLTRQLLTFSKGGAPIKKTLAVGSLLRDTAEFALSGSNVQPSYSVPDDLWLVDADEGQISQVVSNLVINAMQAMPEGGVVQLKAENKVLEEGQVPGVEPGKYVKMSVVDQGPGIPEEHLPRVFDPYFSTKKGGIGLGLATAYSIVRRHSGTILLHSGDGSGTAAEVYLPASLRRTPTDRAVEPTELKGQGRILVMDDEEIIRVVARQLLTRAGYTVDTVNNGEEVVQAYKEARAAGEPFDAVILDLTVPGGMGGKEALFKLKELDPQVKAIVSSGYSQDPVLSDHRKYGFTGIAVKPYTYQELVEAVNRTISEHRDAKNP